MSRSGTHRAIAAAMLALLAVAGCRRAGRAAPGCDDDAAPLGADTPVRRLRFDGLTLPAGPGDFADDLDGDGRPDHQLGAVVALAAAAGYPPTSATAALLAAGRIAPRLELVTDGTASPAAVRYAGAPGDPPALLRGRLDARGAFRSTPARCHRRLVDARLLLPLLPDADPLDLAVEALEIELVPDGVGYRGALRGAVRADAFAAAAARALDEMVRARPVEHRALLRLLDADRDGTLSPDELAANPVLRELVRPDVRLPSHDPLRRRDAPSDGLSLALGFHAAPCVEPAGCTPPVAAAPRCDDRLRDGDEADVDCGGRACPPCPGGAACRRDGDCQSLACRGARCDAPSCGDGRRDGDESDVDCGGRCAPCPHARACRDDDDCAGACSPRRRCLPCARDADCRALGRRRCADGACVATPLPGPAPREDDDRR